ncbi:outer membrane protein assembly factor BamD [Microbulbifer agarilyticus]|uniref:outer membrane protein assembly factor BamD n=1 Tax=Microbulbifer agarilyticus TaxID=260552 RepID=UPI001C9442F8|nr:outer membrane protein assembly factor BamD [Microbulbifer agarilyticus]MBY6191844.1 outer membrane protein assembly factor BamD [Microbulbifer agarilyticus]MBY6212852.1 outer membrane protein assembly factor BamD [Microbulbifer agarilyticus]
MALLAVLVASCASTDEEEEGLPSGNRTEQAFYEAAQRQLRSSQWEMAIKNLRALEDNFPFGNYAEQAQLELIYAYYRDYQNDAAISAADRFIRLHPQHRNVDYAYYMKGLASFTEGSGLFERFLPTDMTRRDPGSARESFAYFAQLMARYPESRYAPDAQKRMIHLRNLLARYEIHVANYYFKRGAYLASANRGRFVVENFQQTPSVPDALAVMVQAYHLLEMPQLESTSLAVLQDNYPDHPAFRSDGSFNYKYYAGASGRSFLHRITLGLFEKSDPRGFDSRELYNAEFQREQAPLPPELQ